MRGLHFLADVVWCESVRLSERTVFVKEATVEGWFRSATGQTVAAAFYLTPEERRNLDRLLARAAERLIAETVRSTDTADEL
jgi:hypothetical protein